jgi:ferritin-like metal-binding protein YciE
MKHDNDVALDLYLDGLRNAHAVEHQAMGIMKRQIERLETYPDVLKRMEAHLKETEIQAERLDSILKEFDAGPSMIKDAGGHMMGTMAALSHSLAPDEILKNTMANYAFENFEIAAYKSLIALADATKQTPHVKLLEQSLGEEIAMASWIEDNIEKVTLKFLSLSEAGKTAKV